MSTDERGLLATHKIFIALPNDHPIHMASPEETQAILREMAAAYGASISRMLFDKEADLPEAYSFEVTDDGIKLNVGFLIK